MGVKYTAADVAVELGFPTSTDLLRACTKYNDAFYIKTWPGAWYTKPNSDEWVYSVNAFENIVIDGKVIGMMIPTDFFVPFDRGVLPSVDNEP